MTPPSSTIFEILDATWPAHRLIKQGPFTLRQGKGGGKRVSAASLNDVFNESDIDQKDDFLSGGVGITIPLSSPSNKSANCVEVLAIIEAEAFLDMMDKMNNLGVLDEDRALAMTVKYMKTVGDKLGIDLEESFLKPKEMLEALHKQRSKSN